MSSQDAAHAACSQWIQQHLESTLPVSFFYDHMPFDSGQGPASLTPVVENHRRRTIRHNDPVTNLELRVEMSRSMDFPAVEWTAYLKNNGKAPSPLIENVQAIDAAFSLPKKSAAATLHTTRGDRNQEWSFEPIVVELDKAGKTFTPLEGRPCDSAWPYFNLAFGNRGVILALGWPGQWSAHFSRGDHQVHIRAGQELTHLTLNPGEEIRTPLVALLFYEGDWIDGQNLWRRWMIAENIPRDHGRLPGAMTAVCVGLNSSFATQKAAIDAYQATGAKYDYWWVDAGWYESPGNDWYNAVGVGTWNADPKRYPNGFVELSNYVHQHGMKQILWFEPERACKGSWVWENHPDWLLHWNRDDSSAMLNLGIPEARQWITRTISDFLTANKIDLFRSDYNLPPLKAWRNDETPNRQGITENLYVAGYLKFWDDLHAEHPGMLFDTCASGGRRNDLETLRRGIPLLRSDYQKPQHPTIGDSIDESNQGQTYGLSFWVPYYGSGVGAFDSYSARSHLGPMCGVGIDPYDKHQWPALLKHLADYRAIAHLYYGDFYPLTPYSLAQDAWLAFSFIRPETGDGMIHAFRRPQAQHAAQRFVFCGLDPTAVYAFNDLDSPNTIDAAGADLMTTGLTITLPKPRSAAIWTFRRKSSGA